MKRIKKPEIRSEFYVWDCPLLTFVYSGFDCGSGDSLLQAGFEDTVSSPVHTTLREIWQVPPGLPAQKKH